MTGPQSERFTFGGPRLNCKKLKVRGAPIMPRFAANLTMMFNEYEFLDRFKAAADQGFDAVEYLFPYEHPADEIAKRLSDNGLTQALFNMPPGDWAKGERGIASLPGQEEDFRQSVATALLYAKATGVKRLHMMAGLASLSDTAALTTYRNNITYAANALAAENLDLLLEPINSRNMPGYALNSFDFAASLIQELALPNVKLQFDLYHCQIIHGDVTMRLRALMPITGHVQIASVPSRHEPNGEELNYQFLFEELDRLNYSGFVGCEYNPRNGTIAGLDWFKPWRRR
jgi:hydroxypyruvate isomerase